MVPDSGSFVVDPKLQGRMLTSVQARKKKHSRNGEAAKIAGNSQPLFLTPLSAARP